MLVSIVIPICNEEKILREELNALLDKLNKISICEWELLLIENGSDDLTQSIAREFAASDSRIRLIILDCACYGLALKRGLLESRGAIIINYDIDYWDIDFLNVATRVLEIKYDIIIASKNLLLSKDKRGWLRKLASYAFRMIMYFVFDLRVSDTHGIKAWRNSMEMRHYFETVPPSHHIFDTEIIVRAIHDDHEVLEIPVEVIERRSTDRNILKRIPRTLMEITNFYLRLDR